MACLGALSACTGLHVVRQLPVTAEAPEAAPEAVTDAYWRYGNFCGKNHPVIDHKQPVNKQVDQLLAIQPIDDVDMACQFHDVCETIALRGSRVCDKILAVNLQSVAPLIPKVQKDLFGYFKEESSRFVDGCTRLISEIQHFSTVYSGLNADDLADMLVDGIGGVVVAVADTPAMLIGTALVGNDKAFANKRAPCIATQEPNFIFPSSQAELAALRKCYRTTSGFSNCASLPTRGRSSPAPAVPGGTGVNTSPLTGP